MIRSKAAPHSRERHVHEGQDEEGRDEDRNDLGHEGKGDFLDLGQGLEEGDQRPTARATRAPVPDDERRLPARPE